MSHAIAALVTGPVDLKRWARRRVLAGRAAIFIKSTASPNNFTCGNCVQRWGHPVFVVETFVDESRYRGTCYRACGFEAVGTTQGFSRSSRDFYQEHGQPKQLYLRELRPTLGTSRFCGGDFRR